MAHVDGFAAQRLEHETGILIVAQRPGVSAASAEPGPGHERARAQAAAVPLSSLHLDFGVRARIGRDVKNVVHGRAAEPENVEGWRFQIWNLKFEIWKFEIFRGFRASGAWREGLP